MKITSVLLNPKNIKDSFKDEALNNVFNETITFFEERGLKNLRIDNRADRETKDWFKYQGKRNIYGKILTPSKYGCDDSRFDLFRIGVFSELMAFYSSSHWYTFQVSLLGCCPIWMGDNETQKQELAEDFTKGNVSAFALSEKEHGADIYSSDMKLTSLGEGKFRADGRKYYIGNAYVATKISTLGKDDEGNWVQFVADSNHEHFKYIKHLDTGMGSAKVGDFRLIDYPVSDKEILKKGDGAFADALLTVNIGKYMVGYASLGLATHSFYEAITHANRRTLYGKKVTDLPHIQSFFTESFCRLNAMKLYSMRGLDYTRSLSKNDRRYMLFNPIEKMKVTTEGEKVSNIIMDIVCAKGYERETFMSECAEIIPYFSRLEGTAHVNLSLVIKFIKSYFSGNVSYPEIKSGEYKKDDTNVLHEQLFGKMSSVTFDDYKKPYIGVEISNVKRFAEIVEIYREMFATASIDEDKAKNMDYMLNIGQIFAEIAYAQLVLEQAKISNLHEDVINEIFKYLIIDVNKYALEQLVAHENSAKQEEYLQKLALLKPDIDKEQSKKFFDKYVRTLDGAYVMEEADIGN